MLTFCVVDGLGGLLSGVLVGAESVLVSSFTGGRSACTGGRSGKRPPAVGELERILGSRLPEDPTSGYVDLGRGVSGIGKSNSTGTIPDFGPWPVVCSRGDPNQMRILTAASESTELE